MKDNIICVPRSFLCKENASLNYVGNLFDVCSAAEKQRLRQHSNKRSLRTGFHGMLPARE